MRTIESPGRVASIEPTWPMTFGFPIRTTAVFGRPAFVAGTEISVLASLGSTTFGVRTATVRCHATPLRLLGS